MVGYVSVCVCVACHVILGAGTTGVANAGAAAL